MRNSIKGRIHPQMTQAEAAAMLDEIGLGVQALTGDEAIILLTISRGGAVAYSDDGLRIVSMPETKVLDPAHARRLYIEELRKTDPEALVRLGIVNGGAGRRFYK